MKAFTPTGKEIVGALETVPGCANIAPDSFRYEADGSIKFDYGGETRMYWEEQRAVETDGQPVYLDDDGEEWKEDELIFVHAILTLADMDEWADFVANNREAIEGKYASVDEALKRACDGGLTIGGGASPVTLVTFEM